MSPAIEQKWVSWLDSDAWRSFGRSSIGATIFESRVYRAADTARRYVRAGLSTLRHPDLFSGVETFCAFIGHVKSGGTLLGALLDAHPRALVADEADAFRYVAAGFGRDQLFHLLLKGSRREALKGRVTARRLGAYDFAVPGQWQGRATRAQVIGDSRASPTTRLLGRRPELLDRLRSVLGSVEDRYVHVVRNPFDPISAMVMRGRRSIEDATADYAAQCARLLDLRSILPSGRVLTVRYEEFTEQPKAGLARACGFLGLDPVPDYLDSCAAIVQPGQQRERGAVDWTPAAVDAVEGLIETVPFLAGYAYEAPAPGVKTDDGRRR